MKRDKPQTKSAPCIGYLLRMYPRFSQTFIVNEILELQRQGLEVKVASLRKPTDGLFHESISRVRGKVHYLPETILSDFGKVRRAGWASLNRRPAAYLRGLVCVLRHAGAGWIDLAQAALLLRWVKKQRIDHVHVHFGTQEATVALLANILGGLSYSLTLHAFDIFIDNVDRRLLARKINASQFTVTVTRFNRRYLAKHIPGVDPDKIRVNHNGIDLDRFKAAGRQREPSLLFAVGRLIEKKGFIDLVRAVGRLRDRGLPVHCKIAGDGPERARLEEEIRRAKLASHVELTGPLEQACVRDLMQRATCFALPCVQARDGNVDALPTVLLESLASGCPSVSTRLSGIPEIIEDGLSGLLVPPGDDAALAQAIGRIIQDRSLAQRLAEGGRRRAEARFDVCRNVAVMHDWFCDATETRLATSKPSRASSVTSLVTPNVTPFVVEASG